MQTTPKIIGIAGTFASGKDTLAQHLVDKFGFRHFSTGDMVRLEALNLRGSVERPVLLEIADQMRHAFGAGYFAKRALEEGEKFPEARGIIITGMRSLGEAQVIKDAGGLLLFVDAAVGVRYERMRARARDAETQLTLEQFADGEAKEWQGGESAADFNLAGIKQRSDIVLEDILDLEEFLHTAEQKLKLV